MTTKPVKDPNEFYVEDTLQMIGNIKSQVRKRNKWAYLRTDGMTNDEVVKFFGMPDGTPSRSGADEGGARYVAVWLDKGEPTEDPHFVTPAPPPGYADEFLSQEERLAKFLERKNTP